MAARKFEGGSGVTMEMKKGGGKKGKVEDRRARVFEFKKPGTDVPVTAERVKMEGLGTRLKFINEFLAKQREKYPLSTKQNVNQFLRRMIVENPEMVFVRYIDIFLGFGSSVTNAELSDFIFEVGYLRENVMKVKGRIESDPRLKESVRPLREFLKIMEKVAQAAKVLAGMSKKEREEVTNGGGGDKLNSKQRAFLKYKHLLEHKRARHFKLAKKKEKEMRRLDRGVEDALAKIEAEEKVVKKAEGDVAEAKAPKSPKKGRVGRFSKAA